MTAQPNERPLRPEVQRVPRPVLRVVPRPTLPKVSSWDAAARGLLNVADIAEGYGSDRVAVRRNLARPGAPIAVARTAEPHRGEHLLLYVDTEIDRFLSSLEGPELALGGRRRSAPVRRIGTSTTPTSGGYRWRDPNRPAITPRLPRLPDTGGY